MVNTPEVYDALMVLSFGGPEGPDDVRPFLENVTRGRGIPPERLDDVAQHYLHFGGVSPINALNRAIIDDVRAEFDAHGIDLPIYFGNRNWHPMIEETVATMRDDGIRNALVFATSAWGGYSGCRQYHEDLARARAAVDGAPDLTKVRQFYDHPLFVEAVADASAQHVRNSRTTRNPRAWYSPRTRFRPPPMRPAARRTRVASSTVARSPRRRSWSHRRSVSATTTWYGSPVRARPRCRGSNPTSSIISTPPRPGCGCGDRRARRVRIRPPRGRLGSGYRSTRPRRRTRNGIRPGGYGRNGPALRVTGPRTGWGAPRNHDPTASRDGTAVRRRVQRPVVRGAVLRTSRATVATCRCRLSGLLPVISHASGETNQVGRVRRSVAAPSTVTAPERTAFAQFSSPRQISVSSRSPAVTETDTSNPGSTSQRSTVGSENHPPPPRPTRCVGECELHHHSCVPDRGVVDMAVHVPHQKCRIQVLIAQSAGPLRTPRAE